MRDMGFSFEVRVKEVDETYPEELRGAEIAEYLAKLKADAFERQLKDNELLITADTIVWLKGKALGKPKDKPEAIRMLKELSGNMHEVFTGVCIRYREKDAVFSARTEVYFRRLDEKEIEFYIENYKPFDKAGSYGAQDWIGLAAIERINGTYFNVMGLPTFELYEKLASLKII
jgi:septum formation protein